MQHRIERAVTIDHIRPKDAPAYIKKKDKQRKEYYNFYADGKWGEPNNYDMCLNASSLGYDACVNIIESML
jgi:cytidylate kinase